MNDIKISSWEQLSIRIIMLFVVVMIVSYIPEISVMRSFFGDTYCTLPNHSYAADFHNEPTWHWGWRHWLFLFMGIALFITQAVRLGMFIDRTKFN